MDSSYDNISNSRKPKVIKRETKIKRVEAKTCLSPSAIIKDLHLPKNIGLEKKIAFWLV